MVPDWRRRKVLIWGKTRPELSKKYREVVCTGGVFEDTRKLVRLYPIPLRYMDSEKVFKKYQWIEAYITKATSDPRPESYRIRSDHIATLDTIPTNKGYWTERASWIIHKGNIFNSVEELQDQQKKHFTSLGLVKPSQVIKVTATRFSNQERNGFWKRYKEALSQMELPLDPETGREIKPISPPVFRFKVQFRCNDVRCNTDHNFSVLDWEIDALYFNLTRKGISPHIAAHKIIDKIENQVCADDRDLYFFLGNISSHPHIFTIVGFWWPKKQRKTDILKQPELFPHL